MKKFDNTKSRRTNLKNSKKEAEKQPLFPIGKIESPRSILSQSLKRKNQDTDSNDDCSHFHLLKNCEFIDSNEHFDNSELIPQNRNSESISQNDDSQLIPQNDDPELSFELNNQNDNPDILEDSYNEQLVNNLFQDYENHQNEDEEILSLDSNLNSPVDLFLNNFLKIMIKHHVKYEVMDDLLILLSQTLCPQVPKTHKTLINRILGDNLRKFKYYLRCDCGVINCILKENEKNFKCVNSLCNKILGVKKHYKSKPVCCSLSMKEQIQKISKSYTKLKGIPDSLDDEFVINVAFSLDPLPLSDDTNVQLGGVDVFICNIEDNRDKNRLLIHKSFELVKEPSIENKSQSSEISQNSQKKKKDPIKFDYDLAIFPFIDELNELVNGFETSWSKITKISVKCFIADAPTRHAVLNLMAHNSEYPCFRCMIQRQKKKREDPNRPTIPLVKSNSSNCHCI